MLCQSCRIKNTTLGLRVEIWGLRSCWVVPNTQSCNLPIEGVGLGKGKVPRAREWEMQWIVKFSIVFQCNSVERNETKRNENASDADRWIAAVSQWKRQSPSSAHLLVLERHLFPVFPLSAKWFVANMPTYICMYLHKEIHTQKKKTLVSIWYSHINKWNISFSLNNVHLILEFLGFPLFRNSLNLKKRENTEMAPKSTLGKSETAILKTLWNIKWEQKARWRWVKYESDTPCNYT